MTDSIWKRTPVPAAIDKLHEETAVDRLGISICEVGSDYLKGRMPVDHRTVQPFGQVHGGATVLLFETLASSAAIHCVDETHICVGLEINCNHIRAVREGFVEGCATAIHVGRSTQVWQLVAEDQNARTVAVGRITIAVVPR